LSGVKVLEGYRVTIPKKVREMLMIEKGDTLELHIEGTRLILRSTKIPESPTLKMLGLAAGNKESLEEAVIGEVEGKLGREKIP
jgi:AbrB family looped-hinge helix DNA binding protein